MIQKKIRMDSCTKHSSSIHSFYQSPARYNAIRLVSLWQPAFILLGPNSNGSLALLLFYVDVSQATLSTLVSFSLIIQNILFACLGSKSSCCIFFTPILVSSKCMSDCKEWLPRHALEHANGQPSMVIISLPDIAVCTSFFTLPPTPTMHDISASPALSSCTAR